MYNLMDVLSQVPRIIKDPSPIGQIVVVEVLIYYFDRSQALKCYRGRYIKKVHNSHLGKHTYRCQTSAVFRIVDGHDDDDDGHK